MRKIGEDLKINLKIYNWSDYSNSILKINYISDLILVDGRFRVACCLKSYIIMNNKSILLVHDYKYRKNYHVIEEFFDIIDKVDTLYVFKKKDDKLIDKKKLDKMIIKYSYDFS